MSYGFARNLRDALPNASLIGLTRTPIEQHNTNPRATFGNHISVYAIHRSVADSATVLQDHDWE